MLNKVVTAKRLEMPAVEEPREGALGTARGLGHGPLESRPLYFGKAW